MKLEGTAKELARMCRERDATIKKKDDVIVALEEKMKKGRDVILTGLKIIEEMLKLGID